MDCEAVLREIELYLDEELAETQCREIEVHLAECGSCLERKEFRARLQALVAKKCTPREAPEGLIGRIRGLLHGEHP